MPERYTDAALEKIKNIHAKWLEGTLASEDVLFQISDVIQTHGAAAETKATGAIGEDQ